jgi:hypothetical protein
MRSTRKDEHFTVKTLPEFLLGDIVLPPQGNGEPLHRLRSLPHIPGGYTMRYRVWIRAAAVALLIAGSLTALAQEFRGTINGTVSDPTGRLIADSRIDILNVETGAKASTTSNKDGLYQVPFLVPGTYTVTAGAAGFRQEMRVGIRVDADANVTVNMSLAVGSTSETVTVSAAAPQLDTTDAELGIVIPHTEIVDQGVSIYRNAANFARLAPGVVGQSEGTYTSDNQTGIQINGGGGALNIGANSTSGTQGGANEWTLDGVPNTVPLSTGSVVAVPSVDTVAEMKVDTTMIDAAHGHSTGGAINMVTKSGTNRLHGTAYAFGRSKGMFANTWQNDGNGTPKPPVDYILWGYTAGGPVVIPHWYDGRNKTFWFSALERDADVRDLSETGIRLPTAAEATGNFSNTLGSGGTALTLYNPYSTTLTGSGSFASRSQFQCVAGTTTPTAVNTDGTQAPGVNCAVIPSALMSPIGQAYLNYVEAQATKIGKFISTAADKIGTSNWSADSTYQVDQLDMDERVDQVLSDKQHAFVRFSRVDRNQFATPLIYGVQQYNGSGSNLDTYLQWRTSLAVNDTYTFSPTFVGSFTYGFARRRNSDSYGSFGSPVSTLNPSWGLPSILAGNQYIQGMPNLADSVGGTPGEDGASLGSRANLIANNLQAAFVTFTKEHGRHSFQFGSDYRLQQYNTSSQAVAAAGQFTFNGAFTASTPTSSAGTSSGSGIAETLLGLPESGSLAKAAPLALQNDYLGLFFQDTWKVNKELSLTLGIRYDLETPYTERHNWIAYGFSNAPIGITVPGSAVVPSFNPNLAGGLAFAAANGAPRTEGTTDKNNFGPRFGFAYQIRRFTVLRGGYAFFYSPMSDILSYLGNVATFSPSTPYTGSTTSNALPAGFTKGQSGVTNGSSLSNPTTFTSLSNPFPAGLVPTIGSSQGLQSLVGQSIEFVNPHRVAPYNQQLTLNVEQQFPGQVLLTVAGVHVLSVKELESFNLNDLPLPNNTSANSTAQAPNPFVGIFPATTTDGTAANIGVETLMTAYPQFGTVTEDGVNSGTTQYNSLQVSIEKRTSHGISVIGTFAWQKTIHNNVESLVNGQYLHNYLDAGYIASNGGAATPTLINWRSIGAYDQPKVWRVSVIYAPPITISGSGFAPGLLRELVEGWQITNWWEDASGLPLAIAGASGFGRPAITCDPRGSGPINQRLGAYFKQSCFQQLTSKYFPVISPTPPYSSYLRAPNYDDINTSLMKNFSIREAVRIQLRGEAYNTLNHPYFSSPGLGCSVAAGLTCTNGGNFGVITSANNSRQVQVGMKILF